MQDVKSDTPKMQIFKIGRGKNAQPILGVRSYLSKYGNKAYEIYHIPSGFSLCDGFYYLSLARDIAGHLLAQFSELFKESNPSTLVGVLPDIFFDYLRFYRYQDTKHALSVEEYTNSPDYQELIVWRNSQFISQSEGLKYAEELSVGDYSLGWVSEKDGPISADRIKALAAGHRS